MKQPKQPKEPFNKTFEVQLPSGQSVTATVRHTKEEIQRPLRVEVGARYITDDYCVPKLRKVRDAEGQLVTRTITVPGVRVRVQFADGFTYEQRSCCKSPDIFTTKEGVKVALKRIFKIDSGLSLNKFTKGGIIVEEVKEKKGDKEEVKHKPKVIKGGQPIQDKTVTPRLSGQDRVALMRTIFRNGKPLKDNIKKVQPSVESQLAVG